MPRSETHLARRLTRIGRNDIYISVALAFLAFLGLFPYLFMVLTSFKTNAQFYENFWLPAWPLHFENYSAAWLQIQPYMITSFTVAALSIVGMTLLSTVTATVLARYRFLGRNLILALVGLLLMIPSIASIIPLFVLMRDLHLFNSIIGLVIPTTVASTVIAIVLVTAYIHEIPGEIFEAALLDGAGGVRTYISLIFPLSLPVIGIVMLLTVINVWNDLFWPALIITDNALRTIPVGLQFFKGQNVTEWGPQFAGYFLASLPLLILFTFLSKQFLAGFSGGLSVDR